MITGNGTGNLECLYSLQCSYYSLVNAAKTLHAASEIRAAAPTSVQDYNAACNQAIASLIALTALLAKSKICLLSAGDCSKLNSLATACLTCVAGQSVPSWKWSQGRRGPWYCSWLL